MKATGIGSSSGADLDSRIAAVRRFNRFYTRAIGTLNEGLLNSRFSLTEVRVLYELAHADQLTATDIRKELGLDNGYLSRILANFEQQRLIRRETSPDDARQTFIRLSALGRKEFAVLNQRQDDAVRNMLMQIPPAGQSRLVESMQTIAGLLDTTATHDRTIRYILRGPLAGDLGWVVQRHGALYTQEYGWDWRFEAYVARIAADFVDHFDPQRERCWIAERNANERNHERQGAERNGHELNGDERDGDERVREKLGCVFLVNHPPEPNTAKLRLLLVEPSARGLGLGKRLVDECTRFARDAGYSKIVLFTCNVLHTARHIYQQAGYRKTHEEPDPLFKPGELSEKWELEL